MHTHVLLYDLTTYGPVTLLRMRIMYELRVIIIEFTFVRATYAKKALENTELCLYLPHTYCIAPMKHAGHRLIVRQDVMPVYG